MHLTADPLLLLAALAFLVPWASLAAALRRSYYAARLWLLRARMGRMLDAKVLVYAAAMERRDTWPLVREIAKAGTRDLVLVLDTRGGDISAGLQVMRALAAHPGRTTVVVPDECWSAGTLAALGADRIELAHAANLGFCDSILNNDPANLFAGPVATAAALGENVERVRARHSLRDLAEEITRARVARGDKRVQAQQLARVMTHSDSDHFQPVFIERARDLGLRVMPLGDDKVWSELVHLDGWAR